MCSNVSNPCLNSDFSLFFILSTAKTTFVGLIFRNLDYENTDFPAYALGAEHCPSEPKHWTKGLPSALTKLHRT